MQKNNSIHTFVILAYQESAFLETCIKSIVDQTVQDKVVIATTTPNKHIESLAKKYQLPIIVGKHTNIGGDFDFALNCGKTPLVTVAHQDDIYEKTYLSEIIKAYHKHPNSSIIFSNYFEIRKDKKVYTNLNLKIKRILLYPLKITKSTKRKWKKRLVLRFGCPICCPSVTFVTKNCPAKIFASDFRSDVDWHAWETLSKKPGAFTYISSPLTGHRISETTATSSIINDGVRIKEDYEMFCRFWPKPIAKLLIKFYQKSEKSNNL